MLILLLPNTYLILILRSSDFVRKIPGQLPLPVLGIFLGIKDFHLAQQLLNLHLHQHLCLKHLFMVNRFSLEVIDFFLWRRIRPNIDASRCTKELPTSWHQNPFQLLGPRPAQEP